MNKVRCRNAAAIAMLTAPALVAAGTVPAVAASAPSAALTQASASQAPWPAQGVFLQPYYTELDLTGDDQVTPADLTKVASLLGTQAVAGSDTSAADVDGDGTYTIKDLAAVSQRIIYDDGPFEIVEASAVDMQAAMNAGVLTSVELTQDYLDRIAAYDKTTVQGAARPLNSIISTNSKALTAAADADAERASTGMTSPLLGIPIVLKDNYNTADMPTTAGCGCWDENQTSSDAFMVSGLKSEGAVILAKASLDEFAYGYVSEYSSFQPAGSSTLVASPYDTSKTAGGSSGGTGAAIAANLAGIGFGTDTGGSIRVPSSYNQLVGVRPTVGLTSRHGIVPLALSQDTGGPIARSVSDAAVALDAVVGVDSADPATQRQTGHVPTSYTASLDPNALAGKRIGYVTSMVPTNATSKRLFTEAIETLEAQGATVVELASTPEFTAVLSESSGSTNEFKHDLDAYVSEFLNPAVEARTLSEIIDSGNFVPSRKNTYIQRDNVTEETYQAWAGPEGSHTIALANGKTYVTGLMDSNDLDALIYPSGTPYGTYSTNMRLSPNTGMPAVTVPMGQTDAQDGENVTPNAGVNLEFLGRDFTEGDLLGLAYSFEQATQARTTPALFGDLK